jgi:hypothetical protein
MTAQWRPIANALHDARDGVRTTAATSKAGHKPVCRRLNRG